MHRSNFSRGNRMEYEKDKYNNKQNLMYKECLYGLKTYKSNELYDMHALQKKEIVKKNKQTQIVLNFVKQKKIIKITNIIFSSMFPNSQIVEALIQDDKPVQRHFCDMTFRDLNISKEEIIEILIKNNILPKNFNEL